MTAGPLGQVPRRRPKRSVGGELELIRSIQARASKARAGHGGALQLGIGDDCAILLPRPGDEIVVTTDFSLENRHFRRDWHSPQSVGHRTLARGLSDIAAMGARPLAAFLSLALPRNLARNTAWVHGFLEGLLALAEHAAVPLAGGDTSEAPGNEVLADIVLIGAVPQGRALRRDGARPGDRLFVTGALGGAAAQLQELSRGGRKRKAQRASEAGSEPHLFPQPRLEAGRVLLRKGLATAAIDLSDGLSTDLDHLCAASGVSAEVHSASLPLHPLLSQRSETEALDLALNGGEDYELLFTVRPAAKLPRRLGGTFITEIGQIVERRRGRPRVVLLDRTGKRRPLTPAGWEHLR